MNKKIILTAILISLLLLLFACHSEKPTKVPASSSELTSVEAKPESYTTAINEVLDEHYDAFVSDVYSYPKDYEGLKYRLRAYYRQVEHEDHFMNYLFKGTDERWMGFQIETKLELPSPGSLILVVGTFKTKMEDGQLSPYLEVESLDVLKEKK